MAKLIYSAFTSLYGYVADETGSFDWAELSDEAHAYITAARAWFDNGLVYVRYRAKS